MEEAYKKPPDSNRDTLVLRRGAVAPSPRLRPTLTHLCFEGVARHGSIRKAADALHIAPSALNRRILDLEDEIGSPLFERLPRGVRLTTAGELLLAYVRRSMKELRTLELQIEGLRRELHGTVRVAVAESVTPRLLPDAVATYQRTHPGVGFHVTVSGPKRLVRSLLEDDADLILTHEPLEKPTISVLAVARHPLCALVMPGHPLASKNSVLLGECAAYPLALPDDTLAARVLLNSAVERSSLPITPALVSNSIETLKTFARVSNAVCFSFHLGDAADVSGMVALRLLDPPCEEARLYLAARRGRVLPVAAASFAEVLAEALRDKVSTRSVSTV